MADILNDHTRENDFEDLALEDMILKYSHIHLPDTGTMAVTVSSHCELTLALHALKQSNPKHLEQECPNDCVGSAKHLIACLARNTNLFILVSEN